MGHLCFILTIKYLGVKAAYALLLVVVPYFIPFSPKSTVAVWGYNRRILNYGRLRSMFKIFEHYYRFGQTIIDKIAIINGMADRYKYDFENYDQFLKVLDSGQGVVMIGAHVGSWEIGAPFFDDYGKKINIVMYDAEYQNIKNVIERNAVKNYRVIPLGEDSLESVLRIKRAIDGGEYVCFQGDRFINGKGASARTFMGSEALFPAGPFLIASRMRVPVVFYFAMREKGRRYRFHFVIAGPATPAESAALAEPAQRAWSARPAGFTQPAEPATPAQLAQPAAPAGPRKSIAPEKQILTQYIAALENIVRTYPQQWFNFYKFWS